ncbi:TldD/PmbA family protein [Candidatus Woesearchaeota archaeon]|nr:TldD/PmbA family protein [Candidatus Woesearchaeota archaeon]
MNKAIELAEYASKRLKPLAGDFAISAEERNQSQIKFSNNKISTSQRWIVTTIGIFASINKRTLATNAGIDRKSVDKAIGMLEKLSRSVSENREYRGIAEGPFKYRETESFDKKMIDLDLCGYVEDSINTCLAKGVKRASGIFDTTASYYYLLTSNNVEANDKSTKAYFSIRALAENDGSGHCVFASRRTEDFRHAETAENAAETALLSQNPGTLKQGKYDIFFEHLPTANLMEHVANSASIFSVEAGLSFLGGKVGKKVGSDTFTMIDDATADWGINSRKFDEEGAPTRKTNIIDKGVMKGYLHNTSTAKKYKTRTTANAGIISPRPINVMLQKGNLNKDEILGKIKKGLLVTNIWYTRFQNHTTGDFSTIPRDGLFLIENGRIKKAVKGLRISDNLAGMLKRAAASSNDSRSIMSWELENPITVPQIHIKDVTITRSEE